MSSQKISFIIIWNVHWAVSEAEEHGPEVLTGLGSLKSCLSTHLPPESLHCCIPFVCLAWWNIHRGFRHAVEDVRDQVQGVGVLYSHFIEHSIILDNVEAPILLFDEENWGCHWWLRWAYMLALEVLIQEVIQLLLLQLGPGCRTLYWMLESPGCVLWCGPISSNLGVHWRIIWWRHPWTPGRFGYDILETHWVASPAALASL